MMKAMRVFLSAMVLAVAPFASAADEDPPARVGRISVVSGEVDFRSHHQDPPEEAQRNYPVTSGNVLATGRDGRAEVRIGSTAIRAAADTEIEFERLDDERIRLRLMQGSSALRVRNPDDAAQIEILTPQGRVQFLEPGRYRVDAGGRNDRTRITVFRGRARFDGSGPALIVSAGGSLAIEGWDPQRIDEGAARADEFDGWSLALDQRDDALPPTPYVSPATTGYEDLYRYGDWRQNETYGSIWIPRGLAADWAPYRYGRWVWVAPWGWTWVDAAPWGFAPFHYGRWALIGATWAWVPGHFVQRPVYAPALVVWLGTPGVSVSIGVGAVPELGWFPLAPREVYVPVYRHTPRYMREVNITHVRDAGRLHERHTKYVFRNVTRAVTVVPTQVLAERRPIRRDIVRFKERRELAALPATAAAPALQAAPPAARPASPAEREAEQLRRQRWEERRVQRDALRATVEQRVRARPPVAEPPRPMAPAEGRSAGGRPRPEATPSVSVPSVATPSVAPPVAAPPVAAPSVAAPPAAAPSVSTPTRSAEPPQRGIPTARDRAPDERAGREREAAEAQRRAAQVEAQHRAVQERQSAERQRNLAEKERRPAESPAPRPPVSEQHPPPTDQPRREAQRRPDQERPQQLQAPLPAPAVQAPRPAARAERAERPPREERRAARAAAAAAAPLPDSRAPTAGPPAPAAAPERHREFRKERGGDDARQNRAAPGAAGSAQGQ